MDIAAAASESMPDPQNQYHLRRLEDDQSSLQRLDRPYWARLKMIGYWAFEDDEKEGFWRQSAAEREERLQLADEELKKTGYWVKTNEEKAIWWNKKMMWRDYVKTHTSMAAKGLMSEDDMKSFQADKKLYKKEYEREITQEAMRKREEAGTVATLAKTCQNGSEATQAVVAAKMKRSFSSESEVVSEIGVAGSPDVQTHGYGNNRASNAGRKRGREALKVHIGAAPQKRSKHSPSTIENSEEDSDEETGSSDAIDTYNDHRSDDDDDDTDEGPGGSAILGNASIEGDRDAGEGLSSRTSTNRGGGCRRSSGGSSGSGKTAKQSEYLFVSDYDLPYGLPWTSMLKGASHKNVSRFMYAGGDISYPLDRQEAMNQWRKEQRNELTIGVIIDLRVVTLLRPDWDTSAISHRPTRVAEAMALAYLQAHQVVPENYLNSELRQEDYAVTTFRNFLTRWASTNMHSKAGRKRIVEASSIRLHRLIGIMWRDEEDLRRIEKWFNQWRGRNGRSLRHVRSGWSTEEKAWLKSKLAGEVATGQTSTAAEIVMLLNAHFQGRMFQCEGAEQVHPRSVRTKSALDNLIDRMIKHDAEFKDTIGKHDKIKPRIVLVDGELASVYKLKTSTDSGISAKKLKRKASGDFATGSVDLFQGQSAKKRAGADVARCTMPAVVGDVSEAFGRGMLDDKFVYGTELSEPSKKMKDDQRDSSKANLRATETTWTGHEKNCKPLDVEEGMLLDGLNDNSVDSKKRKLMVKLRFKTDVTC
ncbi:hypothetical protein LTS18_006708 [Coniosporium uncinatum]|uniref:Uncharacterized protein n=1 Tax=Coniosporium uncinatum TaxID=93489 RepID=A0ACC3DXD2_9PEZI|nr:hypothetical protein LTS18_006708 [Coniosporium uncinatum]